MPRGLVIKALQFPPLQVPSTRSKNTPRTKYYKEPKRQNDQQKKRAIGLGPHSPYDKIVVAVAVAVVIVIIPSPSSHHPPTHYSFELNIPQGLAADRMA